MGTASSINHASSTDSSVIQLMEERIGSEFLLVRHSAKAHHYMLGNMLSDGGKDSTGKTVLVSYAGGTIASRLSPLVTDDHFSRNISGWSNMGPAITDVIGSGASTGGQVQANILPVKIDVSAEAVNVDGRWFNQCRLYSIDEQHFWMWIKGKRLQQDALGIQGKDRFFIITEAYVAKRVGQLRRESFDASASITLPQESTEEDAGAAARLAHQRTIHHVHKQLGEAALAFKFVEMKFDMHGIIQHINPVRNPRQHYTLDPQTVSEDMPAPSTKKTEYV
ncbi:uncharacterized protein LOC144859995 [Branchiostoma floridae x Branchiostoma japonicum]